MLLCDIVHSAFLNLLLLLLTRVKGPFGAQYARPLRGRIITCFALCSGALHLAFSLFNICPTLPSPFNDLPYRVLGEKEKVTPNKPFHTGL